MVFNKHINCFITVYHLKIDTPTPAFYLAIKMMNANGIFYFPQRSYADTLKKHYHKMWYVLYENPDYNDPYRYAQTLNSALMYAAQTFHGAEYQKDNSTSIQGIYDHINTHKV